MAGRSIRRRAKPELNPLTPEARWRLAAGETQTDIARSYGVSHVTIGRLRPFPVDVAGGLAA